MRIAICISGLTRTYKQVYDNFVSCLINPNRHHDIDIFISTWLESDSNTSHQFKRNQKIYDSNTDISDLISLYNPASIEVEDKVQLGGCEKYSKRKSKTSVPAATMSMWYKIAKCDQLRRNREEAVMKKYDWVVRTRFDLIHPERIVVDELNKDRIYVPKMWNRVFPDSGDEWINDKFAIGPSQMMRVYSDVFYEIDSAWEDGALFQPEVLLHACLSENQIPVSVLPYDMKLQR